MRMISQLAKNSKKEDNFGMRDEDWDVYKKISKVREATYSIKWQTIFCKNRRDLSHEIFSDSDYRTMAFQIVKKTKRSSPNMNLF